MSNWRNPRALRILSGVLALLSPRAPWRSPGSCRPARSSEQSLGAFVRERGLSNYLSRSRICARNSRMAARPSARSCRGRRRAVRQPRLPQHLYQLRAQHGRRAGLPERQRRTRARTAAPGGPAANVAAGAELEGAGADHAGGAGASDLHRPHNHQLGARHGAGARARLQRDQLHAVPVGAAGGGVWKSTNALASVPSWRPEARTAFPRTRSARCRSTRTTRPGRRCMSALASPVARAISEAGVGLYKSTDGGVKWALVPGSLAVAKDRAIGAVAIDPENSQHILLARRWRGTARRR